jgi:hypothetical protein
MSFDVCKRAWRKLSPLMINLFDVSISVIEELQEEFVHWLS